MSMWWTVRTIQASLAPWRTQLRWVSPSRSNSTGFIEPSFSDIVLAVIGLVVAVLGFFISGIRPLIRRLTGRDRFDEEEKLPPEEKYDLSAEDAPHTREK